MSLLTDLLALRRLRILCGATSSSHWFQAIFLTFRFVILTRWTMLEWLISGKLNQYTQTLRYPTTKNRFAQSQNNLVAQQLDNGAPSLRRRLYNVLTTYHSYQYFSNEAWFNASNNPKGYDSIESIHDQIHGLTGSGGHMSVSAGTEAYLFFSIPDLQRFCNAINHHSINLHRAIANLVVHVPVH